jgi:tripartite-type tricarboxylate transporter receptor subunit TctC
MKIGGGKCNKINFKLKKLNQGGFKMRKIVKQYIFLVLILFMMVFICEVGFTEEVKNYPSKPVKVIIPWEAGGSTDMMMRAMQTVMSNYFPEPMVIINKPGGGGTIGTTEALAAKPDGYTILLTGIGPMVTQPYLTRVNYKEEDYIPVIQLSNIPRIICAHPDTPYNNTKEMMEYAKANPEKVKVGIAAVGSTGHLGMAQLEMDYDVNFTLIPLGGGGPQKASILGGHVDIAPLNASEAGSLITSNQLKPLGVMASEPFNELPEIITCANYGYKVESGVSWHVYVPKGTPTEIVQVLHDAFKNCIEDEVFIKVAEKLNIGIQCIMEW